MKSTNKLLIGIVAGIVILIIVALVVALTQPEATYQSPDTPDGVVYNYLLALKKGDYEIAWSYLSPNISGYPKTADVFQKAIRNFSWYFHDGRESSFSIDSVNTTEWRSTITVQEVWLRSGDLFDSGQSTQVFDMTLQKVNEEWKIVEADAYWVWCWNKRGGCN